LSALLAVVVEDVRFRRSAEVATAKVAAHDGLARAQSLEVLVRFDGSWTAGYEVVAIRDGSLPPAAAKPRRRAARDVPHDDL
jgi:hypothetical protein